MSFKTPLGKTIFETKPISAGCEFVSGYAFKSKDFSESGYPVIKIKNIQNKQVTLNGDNQFIPKSVITEKLNKFKLTHGDILIAMTGQGSVGRVGKLVLNDKQVTPYLNQRVGKFVPLHNVLDKDYLYYVISTSAYESLLFAAGSGSGQPNLSPSLIKGVEIPFPPIKVQESISKILRDLDEKIVTNVQMNQTLEEMSQAIFQSWFVDFDPVKAKMNGEQPEGMDAATASLFPEKLVESELGLIPEGWEVGTLDSHTSMIIDHRGKTPKKLGSDWVEEGYPAISAKNIKSKKIVRPDTIRFIDEATYKKWMKEPLIKGDIIMTSEAPMGELYFFDGSEDFCLSQRLYGLRANSDVCSSEFLFNWLQTTKAKADMEGRASGTTALGIKQAELRKVKILTPPRELLEKYSAVASHLVDMAAKNNAQNTVLEDLRDTLLPKLLSGEIELGRQGHWHE